MDKFIHIKSTKFPILPGEDEELVNEGMYGKALAEYLQTKLTDFGYDAPFIVCEDWGWWVELKTAPFGFGVCIYCGPVTDGPLDLFCTDGATGPRKWSWRKFRFVDTAPWVEKLHEDLISIFRADSDVEILSTCLDSPFAEQKKSEHYHHPPPTAVPDLTIRSRPHSLKSKFKVLGVIFGVLALIIVGFGLWSGCGLVETIESTVFVLAVILFVIVLPTMWLIGRRPSLAKRQTDPVPSLNDPDFGKISFDGDEKGIWQTHDDIEDHENHARYGFSSIPGDRVGPFPKSRAFLLQKKKELPELWRICTPTLEEVCEHWSFKGLRKPVVDQFVLTSIGIDEVFESSGVLDVGFESKGDFWVYALMTIQDGKVVSHVCDT